MAILQSRTWLKLNSSFLLRPLVITFALVIVGLILPHIEASAPAFDNWLTSFLFSSKSDSGVSQSIFNTIALSVMTVVAIVFSVLLMTLTLASMQFSPRIIINFIEDKKTQYTLGIFLGTFGYCLAAMPSARNFPQPFDPVLTISGAIILALICIIGLLLFINHIAEAISASHIIHQLARQTEKIIDDLLPPKREQQDIKHSLPEESYENKIFIRSAVSGYIRYIDTHQLLQLACHYQTNVRVVRRVGHFVPVGIPLFILSSHHPLSQDIQEKFLRTFEFGPTRVLEQDVEFGILKIVDIGLKAVSPAVNDPSTAITCIDQLSAVLIYYGTRNPHEEILTDDNGKVMVIIPWLDFERLVDSAFEQIRMYAKTDVAVNLRMLRALSDISHTVQDKEVRTVLADRGRKILSGCEKTLGDSDITEMKRRMAALDELAGKQILDFS